MEKQLKLYKMEDGSAKAFPSATDQIYIDTFTYSAQRMGGTPTITATVMYKECLDGKWSGVYATFNGEKYYVMTTPDSKKSSSDARYEHNLTLYSERFALDNIYFIDAVQSNETIDRYKSNSSKILFMGDINEFAGRLQSSLSYSSCGYSVVVDASVTSENKLVEFEDKFISEALQEAFNIYEIPYYFVGKVIHFGYTSNAIPTAIEYGAENALVSIQKTNTNYRIVNRCTGYGSEDNIPFYYPNNSARGDLAAVGNGVGALVVNSERFSSKMSPTDTLLYNTSSMSIQYYTRDRQIWSDEDVTYRGSSIITDNTEIEGYVLAIDAIKPYWQMGHVRVFKTLTVNRAGLIKIQATVNSVTFKKEDGSALSVPTSTRSLRIFVQPRDGFASPVLPFTEYTAEELSKGIEVAIPEAGEYYVEFSIDFGDTAAIHSVSYSKYYVTAKVSFGVSSVEGGFWTLNGDVVELSDVGLKLTTTPSAGAYIKQNVGQYIQPTGHLMPSIFRSSNGAERFYNALNGTYLKPEGNEYYTFANPYSVENIREQIVSFEDIKPTIKGMKNASGQRIDKFLAFAWDEDDTDDINEETGEYVHSYFYAKLPKMNGYNGFNLFDCASESGNMSISMTSGVCGACEFEIGVDKSTQKNIVQVDGSGNLLRDEKGNVKLGKAQAAQNDTENNEVWIALKKDASTYPVIMPSKTRNLVPSTNDTFVILHINLPFAYIVYAENRLYEEIIAYMALNNEEKFSFSIGFSRIFFAENADYLAALNENARILVRYNEKDYTFYISSFKYAMKSGDVLPEISVELVDELNTSSNSLQTRIDAVKQEILSSVGTNDVLKQALPYFLRKDVVDSARQIIRFEKGAEFGKYAGGTLGSGAAIKIESDGSSHAEVDFLKVRRRAEFSEITVDELKSVGGSVILSLASAEVESVEVLSDRYRCYFNTAGADGKTVQNQFVIGDLARSQKFNLESTDYYWRAVVGVGDGYIDLSMEDCDTGSSAPSAGDKIIQLGNKSEISRQSAQILSCYGDNAPCFIMYNGINSYSLVDKDIHGVVFDSTNSRPKLYNYGAMFFGDKAKQNDYISYDPATGQFIIKARVQFTAGSTGLTNLTEWSSTIQSLQNQIDGVVETWFYNDVTPSQSGEPLPSITDNSQNYPYNTWAEGTVNQHLGDLYYSDTNKAYRLQKVGESFVWKEVPDSDLSRILAEAAAAREAAQNAIEAAQNAQATANAANAKINSWVEDGVISPLEYNGVKEEYIFILSDYANIKASADRYSVVVGSLTTAYNAYKTALESIINGEEDENGNISIPSGFVTTQQTYYNERTSALNAISQAAKKVSDDAKDAADKAAEDAAAALNAAISGVDVEYARGTSATDAPATGWTTNAPAYMQGYYIWQRTKTTYANGRDATYSTPTCISGKDGGTPYIGDNGNWWIGTTDTGVKAEGVSGYTPTICANGNWWINGEDTGLSSKGDNGKSPYISTSTGTWWEYDADQNKYVNTGIKAKGESAYSPKVSEDNGHWLFYDDTQKKYVDSGLNAKGDDGHTPYIGTDGYWYEWDSDLTPPKYVKTSYKAQGDNGLTPYIGDDGDWWIGDTDTGILARGTEGHTPYVGTNGNWWINNVDTGVLARGESGYTPTVGENGNWWINGEDTGVKAQGDSPEIGDNGHWWVGGVDTGVMARGEAGNGISAVEEYYQASSNGTTAPSTSSLTAWTKNGIPSDFDKDKPYLWNFERIVYTIAEPITTTPSVVGTYGKDGKGISSIVEHYAKHDSYINAPSANKWSTTFVAPDNDYPVVWNYETIYYTDGTQSDTTPAIIGIKGSDGNTPYVNGGYWYIGGKSTGIKATGENGNSPYIGSNGNWWIGDTDTKVKARGDNGLTPEIKDGEWWIGDTNTHVVAEGTNGVGITSIVELYYMTAKTAAPSKPTAHVTNNTDCVDAWTLICPKWIAGCVYYTCSEIKFDDEANHYSWTDVQMDENYRSRTFYTEDGEYPVPPYSVGDQWACANGTFTTTSQLVAGTGTVVADDGVVTGEEIRVTITNELLVCINEKKKGESFDIADWTPAGGYGKKTDYQYLVNALPQGSTTDVYGGLVLGNILGVKSSDGSVVALMNGLNTNSNFTDSTHGVLMFASGISGGVRNAKNAATRIWGDGTLYSSKGVFDNAEITGKITATSGKIGNFDIDTGLWLKATGTSYEIGFSAAAFNLKSTDYSFTSSDLISSGLPDVSCKYSGTFYASSYGDSITMFSEHAMLYLKGEVKNSTSYKPSFVNIGLDIAVTGASNPYFTAYGDQAGNYAIRMRSGMVSGLRPKVRLIDSSVTQSASLTLSEYDYNVIYNKATAATIKLPNSPQIGQTYRIFKHKRVAIYALTIDSQGKTINYYDLFDESERTAPYPPFYAGFWGVAEYVYDGTEWNAFTISRYDEKLNINND